MYLFIQTPQIGKTRQKSQHIYKVILTAVDLNDFLLTYSRMLRNGTEVRAIGPAVNHRDFPDLLFSCLGTGFHTDYRLHSLVEGLIAYDQRIVIYKKRTVGGYHVDDTGNLLCPDELCSRSDFLIDLRTYDLLELYKQRGISLRHYFDVLDKCSYT